MEKVDWSWKLPLIGLFCIWAWSAHASPARTKILQPAWDALAELRAGNQRFVQGKMIHPKADADARANLRGAEKPHTIVLSCSDSRVPPELIFDQGLGQLYSVRSAGEVLSSPAIASIEFAFLHLGARLLLVLGHESCEAIQAALTPQTKPNPESPDLEAWLGTLREETRGTRLTKEDSLLREPAKVSVGATVQDLLRRSKVIREARDRGEILIAQGIYGLASGQVDLWDAGN